MNKKSAIFVMPRSSREWKGSEALWVTVAGWASAAKRRFGNAVVLTTDRLAVPEEVLHYPLNPRLSVNKKSGVISWIPLFFRTFVKDLFLWKRSMSADNYQYPLEQFTNQNVAFVWEQHDFFPGDGFKLSKKLKVPFVIYVHAPQVWESAKWGVKRYLWGSLLEYFESRSLKRADIVACVSEEVAAKVLKMGIPAAKILVSPMAVDPDLFNVNFQKAGDHVTIGWTGSFRGFHGLEHLIDVFASIVKVRPATELILVGDGNEREAMEQKVADLGIRDAVKFLGRKAFTDIPEILTTFDIAVVSARSAEGFHYSPLKLREYLAAGRAVVAPAVGEIVTKFQENVHLRLYTPGDLDDLRMKLVELIDDREMRQRLGISGRDFILRNGTWDVELDRVLNVIPKS